MFLNYNDKQKRKILRRLMKENIFYNSTVLKQHQTEDIPAIRDMLIDYENLYIDEIISLMENPKELDERIKEAIPL